MCKMIGRVCQDAVHKELVLESLLWDGIAPRLLGLLREIVVAGYYLHLRGSALEAVL